MKLMIGLGNPGAKYARHRHNVGFMAVDAIAERHNFGPWRKKFQSDVSEGLLDGVKTLLVKPQTYMNESGRAVQDAARFYKCADDDVIVFHDELDLAAGKVKVKTGGGAAGHNGLRSITNQMGPEFVRVRIGIGHPGHKDRVHSHVLGDFAKADQTWLAPLLDEMSRAAGRLADGDPARFMTDIALGLRGTSAATRPAPKGKAQAERGSDTSAITEPDKGKSAFGKWGFAEKFSELDGPMADTLRSLVTRRGDKSDTSDDT
ncbi:MAG: aminoacyl-tRNA hydrolase [Pseudomonadota bacterium]